MPEKKPFVILDRPNRRLHKIMLVQDKFRRPHYDGTAFKWMCWFSKFGQSKYTKRIYTFGCNTYANLNHPTLGWWCIQSDKLYVIQVVYMLAIFWIRPNWTIPCRRNRPCLNERMGVIQSDWDPKLWHIIVITFQ